MEPTLYHFQVGSIACTSINDGHMIYAPPMFPPPMDLLFPAAPRDRLGPVLAECGQDAAQWPGWVNQYTPLLVDTGEHRVLIETGAGALTSDTGKLLGNLSEAGLAPEDIDHIILTHGHYDHLGGNADAEGRVAFPSARWTMSEGEWQFWMGGEFERLMPDDALGGIKPMVLGIAQKNLGPIMDRLLLVRGPQEVVPGVEVVPAPGHTPGHMAVVISSGSEKLYCLGDLFLHPAHMREPEWMAALDWPATMGQLPTTRRGILTQAEQENARLMAYHFPFPGVGRATSCETGWRWLPES